jgi:hypothetical protein
VKLMSTELRGARENDIWQSAYEAGMEVGLANGAVSLAAAIAILKEYPPGDSFDPGCDSAIYGDDVDGCDGERDRNGENIGGFCWEHRRRRFLARIKETR